MLVVLAAALRPPSCPARRSLYFPCARHAPRQCTEKWEVQGQGDEMNQCAPRRMSMGSTHAQPCSLIVRPRRGTRDRRWGWNGRISVLRSLSAPSQPRPQRCGAARVDTVINHVVGESESFVFKQTMERRLLHSPLARSPEIYNTLEESNETKVKTNHSTPTVEYNVSCVCGRSLPRSNLTGYASNALHSGAARWCSAHAHGLAISSQLHVG